MALLLWIFYVFVLSCVCYVFVPVCLYVLCGHLLGKGWPLGSHLWCLTVSLSLSHWYPGSGVVLDCMDSWSLHPYLLKKNFRTMHPPQDGIYYIQAYRNLSWKWGYDRKNILYRITYWHYEACRLMINDDHGGGSFLSHPLTNNGFFFLLTIKYDILCVKRGFQKVLKDAEMRHVMMASL